MVLFFHSMKSLLFLKMGLLSVSAVELVCVSACVRVCNIAVLELWLRFKDIVQHGSLVSRVDIWEQSEQRQLADTAD